MILENETTAWLELPITINEIAAENYELQVRKTPGPDELRAAVYKSYKVSLAQQLHKVLSDAYVTKTLPPSLIKGHTVLSPKRDYDAEKRVKSTNLLL